MAVQFRTSHAVEYVSTTDASAMVPAAGAAWPSPDPDWLPAAGQPAECTRFGVRPLSHDELAAAWDAAGDEFARRCSIGLVTIDGDPAPPYADWAPGWGRVVANLVIAITTLPMAGLVSRSRGAASQVSTDGASSGAPGSAAAT